jgi:hypothetical protein
MSLLLNLIPALWASLSTGSAFARARKQAPSSQPVHEEIRADLLGSGEPSKRGSSYAEKNGRIDEWHGFMNVYRRRVLPRIPVAVAGSFA